MDISCISDQMLIAQREAILNTDIQNQNTFNRIQSNKSFNDGTINQLSHMLLFDGMNNLTSCQNRHSSSCNELPCVTFDKEKTRFTFNLQTRKNASILEQT